MDKRERFVASVTCPECALNGSATWEEAKVEI
jgi:Zn ribbon nucleic-acid-binding protein